MERGLSVEEGAFSLFLGFPPITFDWVPFEQGAMTMFLHPVTIGGYPQAALAMAMIVLKDLAPSHRYSIAVLGR